MMDEEIVRFQPPGVFFGLTLQEWTTILGRSTSEPGLGCFLADHSVGATMPLGQPSIEMPTPRVSQAGTGWLVVPGEVGGRLPWLGSYFMVGR